MTVSTDLPDVSRLFSSLFPDIPLHFDPARLRITENDRPVAVEDSLLGKATSVGDYRIDAADDEAGQYGFCGQIRFGDEAAICGVRVRQSGDIVNEIEIIRSPSRFPGKAGIDARHVGTARPAFSAEVPAERRLGRDELAALASGYYEAVNREQPELAPLEQSGARIEAGTQITGNPDFRFEFYRGLDGQELPNFGEWTAREQFVRGLWNADRVPDVRFPIVDRHKGLVFAFMTYCPWGKRDEVEVEGVGRVGPIDASRRVALDAMEVFKIDRGQILEMESVWSIEAGDHRNSWCRR